jgi:hypothetical protein
MTGPNLPQAGKKNGFDTCSDDEMDGDPVCLSDGGRPSWNKPGEFNRIPWAPFSEDERIS